MSKIYFKQIRHKGERILLGRLGLAQFQHKNESSFYKINNSLPIEEVLRLYSTLHEANITKFFDVANTYFKKLQDTNLKK